MSSAVPHQGAGRLVEQLFYSGRRFSSTGFQDVLMPDQPLSGVDTAGAG
jgi:hypothetical protein